MNNKIKTSPEAPELKRTAAVAVPFPGGSATPHLQHRFSKKTQILPATSRPLHGLFSRPVLMFP